MKQVLLACLAAAVAAPAAAQFQKPDEALKYRQAAFTVMGAHFTRLAAMVNGKAPYEASAAALNADVVALMGKLAFTAFGEGTDKLAGSHAKPEVWSEAAGFRKEAARLAEETAKLQGAARSGSLEQLKAQFGATAQTCKSCHDSYRAR